MCENIEHQAITKIKIIGKPIGGLDFRQWIRSDVNRWWELIRARHHSAQDMADIERLKKKYKLEKYYSFTRQ
jgi:hypothetical protein